MVRMRMSCIFMIILSIVVVYLNTMGNSFHFDDFHSIVENPHIRKGHFGKAIEQYKLALEINSKNPATHYDLGLSYRRKGLFNNAVVEFQKVLEIDPDFKEAKRNLTGLMNR